ncbi:hypothetical protein DB41_HT00030 [Neochlamydia sp. TUME1]|nr:hypothetical protein DB41_HT00030 [Neochlamydia sp. TUME1]
MYKTSLFLLVSAQSFSFGFLPSSVVIVFKLCQVGIWIENNQLQVQENSHLTYQKSIQFTKQASKLKISLFKLI